jgi:uncharacterized membrane protein YkvA (DUF1232 family)
LAVLSGLLLVWGVTVIGLHLVGRKEEDPTRLTDAFRLVPDAVRLFRRLAADPSLPKGVRVRMALLAGYLLMPIDLVPDVIPVVGYADDAVIVAIALRSVSRAAVSDAVDRHWPGTAEGLRVVKKLAGLGA